MIYEARSADLILRLDESHGDDRRRHRPQTVGIAVYTPDRTSDTWS